MKEIRKDGLKKSILIIKSLGKNYKKNAPKKKKKKKKKTPKKPKLTISCLRQSFEVFLLLLTC